MTLAAGIQLHDEHNQAWTVKRLLGSGGQGEVYLVSDGASELALKWYFPAQATDAQYAALTDLVQRGAPSDRFLWPVSLVRQQNAPGFGYLMPVRDPAFRGIADLMKRRVEPSFRVLCTACFELAYHYSLLHSKGLSYRDISFGNVFFDPQTGKIQIADNDNVCVNGTQISGVAGTPRFMAPEIVCGEANPSTDTDLYSLAVLLFYILCIHHPLEGKRETEIHCLDLSAMNRLYGTHPLFIFDPSDPSNRPVPGQHENALVYWPLYPQFVRELFTRAFTEGLRPEGRVRESEWRRAMVRLRDSIILGPNGDENFYDAEKIAKGEPHICWATGKPITLPPRLKISDQVVMLTPETVLYPHHLSGKNYDFSTAMGRVIRHPMDATIWGLRNELGGEWSYDTIEGSVQTVPVGKSVTLKAGLTINFGAVKGEVRI